MAITGSLSWIISINSDEKIAEFSGNGHDRMHFDQPWVRSALPVPDGGGKSPGLLDLQNHWNDDS